MTETGSKGSKIVCPECGSELLIKFGTKFTGSSSQGKQRQKVQQYQCTACGRITIKPNKVSDHIGSEIMPWEK
jgi:DNA-directed RNA polymerase subunit RPC12/RpoP